jgi:hypothetical protein
MAISGNLIYMAKKRPEEIIYELKERVAKEFFAEEPLKKFPEDFLSEIVKKELAVPIRYPKLFKSGHPLRKTSKIIGGEHRTRRRKIDLKKVNEALELFKEWEKVTAAKYEEILLPAGKLKLNFGRKFEICFKNGTVLLGFNSLERARYVLYARKKDQYIIKIPKSEIVVKRAVRKYEKYLKEMRDNLIKAFLSHGAEKSTAEGLMRQVFEEMDLPCWAGE